MSPSSDIQSFRNALAESKSIMILTGAGLSVASGIPTYRGADGMWLNHDALEVASPEAWKANPSRVWQFYHRRRNMALNAQPNPAHQALASFFLPSTLSDIAPSILPTSPPLLITQNVDSLSLRVFDSQSPDIKAAAEQRILEMHGSLLVTRCTSCQHTQRSYHTPLASALATDLSEQEQDTYKDIPTEQLPRCGGEEWNGGNRYGKCGGLLRPHVVWFGEVPEHMGEIARRLNWCELFLVVGTSSLVNPAAGFAKTVAGRGGKVAVFNLDRTKGDEEADFLFLGPCEETLPKVLGV